MAETFTSLDTLRQMGLVSLIYNGNHQLCLKFACAGTGITFTGSMDSAIIIAAIKQQMTVDNIGLHGMVGPMGGMMTEYVPLPTVSMSYVYPNQLWNYSVNIGAGASSVLRDQNGNALSYDSTKSYSALNYYTSTSDSAGTIDTNVSIGASGSFLALFNNGSSQITVQRVNVATCADSTSTVITVYDSSNNPYNAFQYTSDGTDYYYVLDGTQTDWTDDLESIGYHLTVPLPTVSMSGFIMPGHVVTINAGSTSTGWYVGSTGQPFVYESTKSYGVRGALDAIGGNDIDPTVFALVDSSGELAVKNISNSSVNVEVIYVSVCSSSLATVITVYDSSNNPYNAFKYTSDGTDYYYVLDGTQTDWTDDLSGIGYKLPTIGYVSSLKTEISMNAGGLQTLYDKNGTKMTVSTYGISYPAVRVYSSSSDTTGTAVVNKNWTVHGPQFSSGDLSVSNLTGSAQTIQRIAFIK